MMSDELDTLKRQLRDLRAQMRWRGIKKTSPFNGGMDMDAYRANAERFRLETLIKEKSSVNPRTSRSDGGLYLAR